MNNDENNYEDDEVIPNLTLSQSAEIKKYEEDFKIIQNNSR